MAISPDMATLVTDNDEKLIVWDFKTGNKVHKLTACTFAPLLITSNSSYLINGDYVCTKTRPREVWENIFKVWDLNTGKAAWTLDNKGIDCIDTRIHGLALSPNGELLACCGTNFIWIWNFVSGQQIQRVDKFNNVRLHKHLDVVYDIVFSLDNKIQTTMKS